LIIPPVKLVKEGVVDQELSLLIRSNVRTPDVQMGDLRAQVAANNTGIRRVLELVDQYGTETLHSAMAQIMDYSEHRMRQEISLMPDGVYEGVDYLEDVLPGGVDVEIRLKVTKKGDSLEFDYTGRPNDPRQRWLFQANHTQHTPRVFDEPQQARTCCGW